MFAMLTDFHADLSSFIEDVTQMNPAIVFLAWQKPETDIR